MARYMTRIRPAGAPSLVALAYAGLRAEEKKANRKTKAPEAETKAAKREPRLAHPKDEPWRSEPYRRLVALRPCENCGRQGRSQAAHVPTEGKSIKQDDRETFALCTVTPDGKSKPTPGCHERFDQYQLGDRAWTVKQGQRWAAKTRAELLDSGQLPPRLAAKVKAYIPPRKRK